MAYAKGSKSFGQASLSQYCIRCVTAWDTNGNGEVLQSDWAMPNFVAALALSNKNVTRRFQHVS